MSWLLGSLAPTLPPLQWHPVSTQPNFCFRQSSTALSEQCTSASFVRATGVQNWKLIAKKMTYDRPWSVNRVKWKKANTHQMFYSLWTEQSMQKPWWIWFEAGGCRCDGRRHVLCLDLSSDYDEEVFDRYMWCQYSFISRLRHKGLGKWRSFALVWQILQALEKRIILV